MKLYNLLSVLILTSLISACGNDGEIKDRCSQDLKSLSVSVTNLENSVSQLEKSIDEKNWVLMKEEQKNDLKFILKGAQIHLSDIEKMQSLQNYEMCSKFANQLTKLNTNVNMLILNTGSTINSVEERKKDILSKSKCNSKDKCEAELNSEVKNELSKSNSKIEAETAELVSELQKMTIDLGNKKSNKKSVFSTSQNINN